MALITPSVKVLPKSQSLDYDGSQLRPHWIYEHCDLQGDAVVAFHGACSVVGDDLVDLADRKDGLFIKSDAMLHVIYESFGVGLRDAVYRQRFLVMSLRECLEEHGVQNLRRDGDDLFANDGKLSVSIATVSPVSALVHVGVNVRNDGTPVKTSALSDFGVESETFAKTWLEGFAGDIAKMAHAATKVRPLS